MYPIGSVLRNIVRPKKSKEAGDPASKLRELVEPFFDKEWYCREYLSHHILASDPIAHFLSCSAPNRPHPLFHTEWYLKTYPEVAVSGFNPFVHYILSGESAGYNPNPFFEVEWYRAYHLAGNLCVSPLRDYIERGIKEGAAPSPRFDPYFLQCQTGIRSPVHAFSEPNRFFGRKIYNSIDDVSLDRIHPAAREASTFRFCGRIAVGFVLYNNSETEIASAVSSAQRSLSRCGGTHHSISAYDNSTAERRCLLPADVISYTSGSNVGFGAAHNFLMKRAFAEGADVYIGANPDGTFHPNAIERLTALHKDYGGRALIEAQIFPDENRKYYDPETLETAWVGGACFLAPRALFECSGGFDDQIFLYCEDVDLSWTAERLGFKLLHCPGAWFFHDHTARQESDLSWRRSYMLSSGRYIGHKWNSDAFCEYCEEEIRQEKSLTDANFDLTLIPRFIEIDHSNNFKHGFAFSPCRK